jgi:hypothetical protein
MSSDQDSLVAEKVATGYVCVSVVLVKVVLLVSVELVGVVIVITDVVESVLEKLVRLLLELSVVPLVEVADEIVLIDVVLALVVPSS